MEGGTDEFRMVSSNREHIWLNDHEIPLILFYQMIMQLSDRFGKGGLIDT